MRTFLIFVVLTWLALPCAAKPPQAPPVSDSSSWVVTETDPGLDSPPCGIDGCACGCTQGKVCDCSTRAKAIEAKHQRLLSEGWEYREDGYYYFVGLAGPQPAPVYFQPQYQPQPTFQPQVNFQPQRFFGGGGFRSGGGRASGC